MNGSYNPFYQLVLVQKVHLGLCGMDVDVDLSRVERDGEVYPRSGAFGEKGSVH